MNHDQSTTSEEPRFVSGRFLSDLMGALERNRVSALELVGDLPIAVGQDEIVCGKVEWIHFAEFMKRLETRVGGPEGLEACGALICALEPAAAMRSLAGFAASPLALYRAATRWALRRAMPGVETRIEQTRSGQLEIHAQLADGLRACPQIFHLAIGGARALPRLLGLPEAVVDADVAGAEAHYRITLPPSHTLFARIRRLLCTVFSAGSVLHFLEMQQLELHAKHTALQKAHDALGQSERRFRALTDAAADVLCEIDETGRIVYVSPAIEDLIGYSTSQVTGSHFRLWVPTPLHARVTAHFEAIAAHTSDISEAGPGDAGRSFSREVLTLHTKHDRRVVAEMSLRSYRTPDDEWRLVCILRDVSNRFGNGRVEPGLNQQERAREAAEANLAMLRGLLSRLPGRERSHPIERSLAVLIAKLGAMISQRTRNEESEQAILRETDRMVQIVDAALRLGSNPAAVHEKSDWIELAPFMEKIGTAFKARGTTHHTDCRIDLSAAPDSIWTTEEILAAGIASLLDWAATPALSARESIDTRHHEDRSSVVLRVEAEGAPETGGAITFLIDSDRSESSDRGRGDGTGLAEKANDPDLELDFDLPLAIAHDAASALDGELSVLSQSGARRSLQLRLPQPPRRI